MNMDRLRTFGFAACLGILGGCTPGPVQPETPLKIACAKYCDHARTLQCAEGQPLPNGDSCETFCEHVQSEGHDLKLACRTTAPSCAVMENCHLH